MDDGAASLTKYPTQHGWPQRKLHHRRPLRSLQALMNLHSAVIHLLYYFAKGPCTSYEFYEPAVSCVSFEFHEPPEPPAPGYTILTWRK